MDNVIFAFPEGSGATRFVKSLQKGINYRRKKQLVLNIQADPSKQKFHSQNNGAL